MSAIEKIQTALWPLLWLLGLPYRAAIALRNFAYSSGWLDIHRFPVKIISIGNLEAGGTGKTPHVEWLCYRLAADYNLGIVSRGYGRKSLGVLDARSNAVAAKIGDEPLLLHRKFPGIPLIVSEKRAEGIDFMLKKYPDVQVILLDDGFQHRAVARDVDILLTRESKLFTKDHLIPAGRLREPRSNRRRAQFIICTHTSKPNDDKHRLRIKKNLRLNLKQSLFFSSIKMGDPYPLQALLGEPPSQLSYDPQKEAVSVAGIAHPHIFHEVMSKKYVSVEGVSFKDHHTYTIEDLESLTDKMYSSSNSGRVIAITEKDAVKWAELYQSCQLERFEIWVWPIAVQMPPEDESGFFEKLNTILKSE